MQPLYVAGIGVWSPAVPSWPACQGGLLGEAVAAGDGKAPPADWLPPIERRRATLSTRVVLSVAKEALTQAQWDPAEVPTVFASSSGSPDITNELCSALAAGDTQISPTRFHNSVHNAAAGYYGIAVACHGASTTIGAHDASAAMGVLEAAAFMSAEATRVLFVAFDVPYTGPLAQVRPIHAPFGVALALAAQVEEGRIAKLSVDWHSRDEGGESSCENAAFEHMRRNNPSARLLPVLEAIAGRRDTRIRLAAAGGGAVGIEVARC